MTIQLPSYAGSYLTPSFEHARVADAMRPRVLTCDAADPLVEVARGMTAAHVHAIDHEKGRPIGVLSTLDVAGILAWGRG